MDTIAQKAPQEQSAKDTSSGITQSPRNSGNTIISKILNPLRRLSAPWLFNSFNVIILLTILFLIILQPHWKKGNTTTPAIDNTPTSSGVGESEVKIQDPQPVNSQTQQGNGTAVTEIGYTDINKANELFERKEYEQALMEYIKVVETQGIASLPTDEDLVQYRLGECYQKLGRLDEAITAYRNIITERFQSLYQVRATLKEGECLVDNGDFLKARKLLFALVAQEARYSDEDKGFVAEAYYKIAESYMKEALRYARIQGYAFANEKK
ncbi:MAG TPA: tetratricopeptide repeat protein [Candidatus Brocadiales bacterium]|nr:tetratricopeptide repeat protein [Candidatus Brocadiales bacterium]